MNSIEMIVPCYNEEACVEMFYDRICEVFSERELKRFSFIITYVDDGSKDNTMSVIKKVVAKHASMLKESAGNSDNNLLSSRVQYISLSRNFGKESAMYAGLSKATGDYVCILDADLQHPPELMNEMILAIENEGYDCASARRIARKGEPFFRTFFSKMFFGIINNVTVMDLVPGGTDYRLMKRCVAEAIVSMPESERFTKGIYSWIGFKNKWIEYKDVERVAGQTTWNFRGLLRYAYSGFIAFATTPLRGVVYLGSIVVVIALAMALYTLITGIIYGTDGSGYATLLVVVLLLGGSIILILGMIGEYLARIYLEVKRRPIFFTRESNIDITPDVLNEGEDS